MPANYFKIHPKRNLVSIRWLGEPMIQDWYDVLERILGHADYQRGMNLITYRTGHVGPITSVFVREVLHVIERCLERMTPVSMAIVAPVSSDFGMARMMETLSDNEAFVVRAFKRPREAMEWLKAPIRYEHKGQQSFHLVGSGAG